MKLLYFDAGRSRRNSGYGHASRNLLSALLAQEGLEIVLLGPQPDWEDETAFDARIDALAVVPDAAGCDMALQVTQPNAGPRFDIPTGIYTFLDVSGPTVAQEAVLRSFDLVLAPNTSTLQDYQARGLTAALFQPSVNTQLFKPNRHWRPEGQAALSFIFVGTYSYRKGGDILLDAFTEAFPALEAHLHIHIPGNNPDRLFSAIMDRIVRTRRGTHITVSSQYLSLPWLSRFYGRSDCYVTATRGEGWGIPAMEAMAAGLPVLGPINGGMKDFMDPASAFELTGQMVPVREISDPFGGNFKSKYDDTNALSYFEPDRDALVAAFREVAALPRAALQARGDQSRAHVLKHFGPERAAEQARAIVAHLAGLVR